MVFYRRTITLIACSICLFIILCPVTADGQQIMRVFSPESPAAGEVVTVTLTMPPSFFGGVIETIPEGFIFEGTSHPSDAVKKVGQTVIFAATGEDEIKYTIRMPDSGCGYLNGNWENLGEKTSGTIPSTLLSTPGADTSKCTGVKQSPGFALYTAIFAVGIASGCAIIPGWRK
jgi:hypothetical protein